MDFNYLYTSTDFDHDIIEILNDKQKTEQFRLFLISGDIKIFSLPWKQKLDPSLFDDILRSIVINFPYPDDFLNFISIFDLDSDLIIPLYESYYSQNKQIFFKPFVKSHCYINNDLFRPLWHGIITKDISESMKERNHPRLRLFLKKYNPTKLKLDTAFIHLTDKDLIYTLIDFYGICINYFKLNDEIISHMLSHGDHSVYILMKLIENNIEFNEAQLRMIKSNHLMYEMYVYRKRMFIDHQPDDLNYKMVSLLKSQNYHFNNDDLMYIINSGVFDNHGGFITSDQAEELIDVWRGKNKTSKLFKNISQINFEHINNFLFHNNVKPETDDVFLLGDSFISTLIKTEHPLLNDIIPLIINNHIEYNHDYFYPPSIFKSQISFIKNNFSENILPFILKHHLIGMQYIDIIKEIDFETGIWYENILNIAENMNMENNDIRTLISEYIENDKGLNEIELLF